MKTSVFSSADVDKVTPGTNSVHLVRPISKKAMSKLLNKTRKLYMSGSTKGRLSRDCKKLLDKSKINVEISKAKAGRAIETPPEKIAEILDLKREGLTVREIAGELDMTKSTVHYLMKYEDQLGLQR